MYHLFGVLMPGGPKIKQLIRGLQLGVKTLFLSSTSFAWDVSRKEGFAQSLFSMYLAVPTSPLLSWAAPVATVTLSSLQRDQQWECLSFRDWCTEISLWARGDSLSSSHGCVLWVPWERAIGYEPSVGPPRLSGKVPVYRCDSWGPAGSKRTVTS